MIRKVFVGGKPYLLDDDGTMLPPVMGGQWGDYTDPNYGAGSAPTPAPAGGQQAGQLQTWGDIHQLTPEQRGNAQSLMGQINPETGQRYTAQEAAAAVRYLTPEEPEPQRGFAPPAPPAFSGTAEGMQLGSQLGRDEMQLQSSLDQARLMAQQGLIGQQQMEQLQAQAQADYQRAKLGEQGAMQRTMAGEMGAGARSQLEAAAARNRALFGEMGAGARTQMETGTQRAIAAGQNVSQTFGQMGEMMTSPSDYLKLAYNVQGMRPMADTPTDIARQEMQRFHGQQMGLAGAPQQGFAEIFDPMRGTVGADPTFGEIFDPLKGNIPKLQFGGRAQNAAITGEKGKPELVMGENIQVVPGLTASEMRALRAGGVGAAQFGMTNMRHTLPAQNYGGASSRLKDIESRINDTGAIPRQFISQKPGQESIGQGTTGGYGGASPRYGFGAPNMAKPALAAASNQRQLQQQQLQQQQLQQQQLQQQGGATPQNVFDIAQQRQGYEAPLFSGGYGRMGQGGIGGVTGLAGLNPLDYSYQQINQMLPFEQEMLASRFGESIIDPNTGQVMRAGLDPSSLAEIIKRSSWMGGAQQGSRWG